jgi:hypothetical protein
MLCQLKNPHMVFEHQEEISNCQAMTDKEIQEAIGCVTERLEFVLDMIEFRSYGWSKDILVMIFGETP